MEHSLPIEQRFDAWVKGRQSRYSPKKKQLVYLHGSTWRTEEGWKKYWKQDREVKRKTGHSARKSLKAQAITLLGGKCAHCGYRNELALQIDHIHGGGHEDRKKFASPTAFYKHVIEAGKKKFQLLCANCNLIKRHTNWEFRKPRFG